MNYRAVGRRCAVNLNDLKLPISNEQAINILKTRGFHIIPITAVAMIAMLREYIGQAKYRRGASLEEAPGVMDCSSLTKWAYGQRGIYLPRHSIAQRDHCSIEVKPSYIEPGDLVFTTGFQNYFWTDPNDGVGHVGLATGEDTVIHAANSKVGIIESPLEHFLKQSRGIRRLVPNEKQTITIESPAHIVIEESNQLRWMILQHCPLTKTMTAKRK